MSKDLELYDQLGVVYSYEITLLSNSAQQMNKKSPMQLTIPQVLLLSVLILFLCRYKWPLKNSMRVIRCSEAAGDFVYKVLGTESCYWTFCGVDSAEP